MGYAKYHEDNLRIFEERMYYRGEPTYVLRAANSSSKAKKYKYSVFCPFCGRGLNSHQEMADHIFNCHGRRYDFIYLNNEKLSGEERRVNHIYSLKFYSFRDAQEHVEIRDDFDRRYYIDTTQGKFEYDITSVLKGNIFSFLSIQVTDSGETYEIYQDVDISDASIDSILRNRYVSGLFDSRVSNDLLNVRESLLYLKMLIHEGEDAEPFVLRVIGCNYEDTRDLTEVFWYYSLYIEAFDHSIINDKQGKFSLWVALFKLLNGDYKDVDDLLKKERRSDNDAIGLRLIYALLVNDYMAISYNELRYSPYGIVGMIVKCLMSIRNYESNIKEDISEEFKELSLLSGYPLIKAFMNFNLADRGLECLSKESYDLLRNTGAVISCLYCNGLSDVSIVEKIIKSNVKLHPESKLLKQIALDKRYSWIGNRISVKDGEVYKRKLLEVNSKRGQGFSLQYLDMFPYDEDIVIMPLGGENGIGASCFVISYKGCNIMLDAGVDPKKRDEASYPALDNFNGRIDLILLSHAHLDHSGGIPKAHAMWNNARILMTKPTKVLLKYIYSDMARVKNGISDDFEIENINITREVMEDTFAAISTVEYEDVICVNDDIEICFHKAGHIVGAAMIELKIAGKTILYTGDYTDFDQNFVGGLDCEKIPRNIDYLITEATYLGGKPFDRYQQSEDIKNEILKSISVGNSVLLPAASIGRSQELLCIIGEMLRDKVIPEEYTLHIAGMAIPTSTQLIPFFNSSYEALLANFIEFDGTDYPAENSIVIASSGNMKKGSASYKIEKYWRDLNIDHVTILGGLSDEESDYCNWTDYDRCRKPLSTHVSKAGILRLIDYTQPKVLSLVHSGTDNVEIKRQFEQECQKEFNGDLFYADLKRGTKCQIFNLLKQLLEENDGRQ